MQALSENNSTAYTQSAIHRLDPRTKMMICLLASVVVIVLKGVIPLFFLLTASIIYVLFQKRFRVLLVCYGAIMAMGLMALFCCENHDYFHAGNWKI
jgi:Cobalt transport protein.